MKKQYEVTVVFMADNKGEAEFFASTMLTQLRELDVKCRAGKVVESPCQPPIVVYTDGGWHNTEEAVGAWAYHITFPDGTVKEDVGVMASTTNNRMEMRAVIKALEKIEPGPNIKVYSDSQYVIKGITVWSKHWQRNGWVTSEGKPVKNRDLWKPLLELYKKHNVIFEHVKGHNGNPRNEYVDRLCASAMKAAWEENLAGVLFDEIEPVDQDEHIHVSPFEPDDPVDPVDPVDPFDPGDPVEPAGQAGQGEELKALL